MGSASSWQNEMDYYSNKIKQSENDKIKYEKLLEKLKKMQEDLPLIKLSLQNAEDSFLSGGYVDNGESLDRGVLKANYQNLENLLEPLKELIVKVERKIRAVGQAIIDNTEQYNHAYKKYRSAKKEEDK